MSDEYDNRLEELNELIRSRGDYEDLPLRESYYLNNWYRYKKNLKELNKTELEKMRELYRGLKELPLEDRNFLAIKYDRPKRPNDEILAGELGMEVKEYSKQRREIQRKLKSIMQEQKNRQRGEMTNDK
ncbi:hypothetical protein [Alkalibacterium sp. MB6]|uniref:hypothetical protein n=1 Tax=Alkalibacterium sp. MB6 TaxID=2081965 RepID=UPI00137ADB53|nr:hypothetical protein [Alkalibacterium sp. MB6]